MLRVNLWAVAVAAVPAFVASSVYYTVLGPTWLELRGLDPSTLSGQGFLNIHIGRGDNHGGSRIVRP